MFHVHSFDTKEHRRGITVPKLFHPGRASWFGHEILCCWCTQSVSCTVGICQYHRAQMSLSYHSLMADKFSTTNEPNILYATPSQLGDWFLANWARPITANWKIIVSLHSALIAGFSKVLCFCVFWRTRKGDLKNLFHLDVQLHCAIKVLVLDIAH